MSLTRGYRSAFLFDSIITHLYKHTPLHELNTIAIPQKITAGYIPSIVDMLLFTQGLVSKKLMRVKLST